MKNLVIRISILFFLLFLPLIVFFTSCKKDENPIKFTMGTVPDSVYNLSGLNSQYDDYNTDLYILGSRLPIIFSSNRGSSGGQFDLVQGTIWMTFDQTNGEFEVGGEMNSDIFYGAVITKCNTAGNDFGPYSIFSSSDSYEYMFVTSEGAGGQLDLYFCKYLPKFGDYTPAISGPTAVTLLNSSADEAYISFDSNLDTAYFCSNSGGNFDIYAQKRNVGEMMDAFLTKSYSSSTAVDSINTSSDEKCPFIFKDIMIFTSNMAGGMGGYDLYYSLFKNGKWNSPVNMGPEINSSSDEFRPVIGYHPDFTNLMIVYSSNKPGGSGGFDLYFTGFTFPE
jgi:hypothetical protein